MTAAATLRFLDPDSPELARAFALLPWPPTADPCAACCPCCGECWQYMGTVHGVHQFRHRHHPGSGQRRYVNVRAA